MLLFHTSLSSLSMGWVRAPCGAWHSLGAAKSRGMSVHFPEDKTVVQGSVLKYPASLPSTWDHHKHKCSGNRPAKSLLLQPGRGIEVVVYFIMALFALWPKSLLSCSSNNGSSTSNSISGRSSLASRATLSSSWHVGEEKLEIWDHLKPHPISTCARSTERELSCLGSIKTYNLGQSLPETFTEPVFVLCHFHTPLWNAFLIDCKTDPCFFLIATDKRKVKLCSISF